MSYMTGIDISHYQQTIDISSIDADFIICKATQGISYLDPKMSSFISAIKLNNKLLGLYHFADGNYTGEQEAQWFVQNISPYIGEAILFLDWESDAIYSGASYAKEFCNTVYSLTKVKPIIYGSYSVVSSTPIWGDFAESYPYAWVAQYGDNPERHGYVDTSGYSPRVVGSFNEIMLQYSSNTFLDGYSGRLDADICYIDLQEWEKLATPEQDPPIPPEPPTQDYTISYTVRQNDNGSKIAILHRLTLNELSQMNPDIQDLDNLSVGQKIRIK